MNGTTENVTHENDDVVTPTPIWLKILVFGLGAAIIGMLGLILYKIISGVGEMSDDRLPPIEVAAVQPVASPFVFAASDIDIVRPAGMKLVSAVPAGSELFLHFRGENGADQIVILNRSSGAVSRLNIVDSED